MGLGSGRSMLVRTKVCGVVIARDPLRRANEDVITEHNYARDVLYSLSIIRSCINMTKRS